MSPWVERLGEGLGLAYASDIPLSFFGDYHQRCVGRPFENACFQIDPDKDGSRRRDRGVHYTPSPIVDYLVCRTLGATLMSGEGQGVPVARILDPSCGCGAFLVAALKYSSALLSRLGRVPLTPQQRLNLVASSIFGTDVDPRAVVWTIRLLLLGVWQSSLRDGFGVADMLSAKVPDLRRNVVCADFLRPGSPGDGEESCNLPERFDAIIGGPPFVRLQHLYKTQPERIAGYKREFATARSGQFDLYMLFIERAIERLAEGGRLGFSVSGAFLRSASGCALRKLIAGQTAVEEIVEFEDSKVYPDAVTPIALLHLYKSHCRTETRYVWVRGAGNLAQKMACLSSATPPGETMIGVRMLPYSALSSEHWMLPSPGETEKALVQAAGVEMGSLPIKVRNGLTTGADDVFLVKVVLQDSSGMIRIRTRLYGETFRIESGAVRPILRGRDIRGYVPPAATTLCVFPFDENGRVLEEDAFRAMFPQAYQYLAGHRHRLEAKGAGRNTPWYAPRFRNPGGIMKTPRLVSSMIDAKGGFTLDFSRDLLCHCSVLVVLPEPGFICPYYLLAILNSDGFWSFAERQMPAMGIGRRVYRITALRGFPLVMPDGQNETAGQRISDLSKALLDGTQDSRAGKEMRLQIDDLVRQVYSIRKRTHLTMIVPPDT